MTLVNKTFSQLITFTRASSATFVGSNGLIQSATTNTPRFDYDPVTLAAKGLLIEEQRTNLLTYSEQFDNAAWTRTGVTVTPNTQIAPDGTQTADLITGGGNWFAQASATLGVANQQLTASIWVYPPAGVNSLTIRIDRNGIAQGNQTVKTVLPEVWQRVTHTATLDASTAAPVLRVDLTGGASLTVWGAQLETGTFATSYIPTVASQVTRSADVASVNTLSPWFNASAGTLFSEFDVAATTAGGGMSVVSIATASTNGYLLYKGLSAAGLFAYTDSSSSVSLGNLTVNAVAKAAIAYDGVNNAGVFNGATPAAIPLVAVTPPTLMYVGRSYAGTQLSGHIRRITYYKRRLSNADLQSITL